MSAPDLQTLAAIVESSDDAICSKSLDGTVLSWNEGARRIFGFAADEVVGRRFSVPVPPGVVDQIPALMAAVRRGEHVPTHETERFRKDGERVHVSLSLSAIRDAAGEVTGFAMIARNITARKRAEEALRESEERFRLATEAISGLVYDWDMIRDRVRRSGGLRNLLGYDPEEVDRVVGWWTRQIHPDDFEEAREVTEGAIASRASSFSCEYRVRHRDGHWVWVWDRGIILRDEAGNAARMVGSTVDISDRKRVEEELRAASEAKDRFLATLSHELRTPLTPVLAVVSSLEGDERLSSDLRADLAMIRRNVELEARLIDDLLDLTRVSRGKLELHREVIDARDVLAHALRNAEREIAAKELRLTTEIAADAPGDHRLWADAPRLTQVFWNLLNNAIKFTPPGGEIAVRSFREGDDLVFEVADSGIGIEPDVLPRVFGAFEQADRRITRQFGGLGLGLAVSRAIIRLHGGDLTAASEGRDRGATFTVRLPVRLPEEDLDETVVGRPRMSAPARAAGGRKKESGLHLLLVEDHADTAEAMADLLRSAGYRVSVAGNVAAALAEAERQAGDLDMVVSDLGLPDGSGFDLMRQIAGRYGLPGIALSGYGMDEDLRRSREAGFTMHLTKPVTLQLLQAAILDVVGR